jgi:lipoprotein NlpI
MTALSSRGLTGLKKGQIMRFWGLAIGTAILSLSSLSSRAVADQACFSLRGDEAIAACTRDIENSQDTTRGRRSRAIAYNNRGDAYRAKGDIDLAIADYDEAIVLDPNYAHAYYNRGNVFGDDKGDASRAIADFNDAIRLNPNYLAAYFSRARAYFYSGNSANALADIGHAAQLSPKDAYMALWLDVIAQRANAPSRLTESISSIDMTVWPAPVVQLFVGRLTPTAVLAAAEDDDPEKKKGKVCEANFYGGELALRQKSSMDEAVRQLRLAAAACPPNFAESFAAKAELKALGITP